MAGGGAFKKPGEEHALAESRFFLGPSVEKMAAWGPARLLGGDFVGAETCSVPDGRDYCEHAIWRAGLRAAAGPRFSLAETAWLVEKRFRRGCGPLCGVRRGGRCRRVRFMVRPVAMCTLVSAVARTAGSASLKFSPQASSEGR